MQNFSSTKTFAMKNLYITVEKRKRERKKKVIHFNYEFKTVNFFF